MIDLVWLVPALPLLGWLLLGLFGNKMPKNSAGIIGCGTIFLSFLLSVGIFYEVLHHTGEFKPVKLFDWIAAGNFSASFSFLVDPLSSLFLLIITGVGFL